MDERLPAQPARSRRGEGSRSVAAQATQSVVHPYGLVAEDKHSPPARDPNLIAPNLAQLAREGAWCSRAYTSYPGLLPVSIGHTDRQVFLTRPA